MATNEGVSIVSLEVEGFKRIKAVRVEPTAGGITIIGGKNRQGKTSVLDAIVWTLGGDKYRPTDAQNADSETPPEIKLTLSNGLTVERKGKNGSLTIKSEDGLTGGQALLNRFIEQLALDLPKFMGSTAKEKANILLQIIGAGDELAKLDTVEKQIFDNRRDAGRDADQAEAIVANLTHVDGLPVEPISIENLLAEVEAAEVEHRAFAQKNRDLAAMDEQVKVSTDQIESLEESLKTCKLHLEDLTDERNATHTEIEAATLPDVSEIRERLSKADETNQGIRDNAEYVKARSDALIKRKDHAKLDLELRSVRETRSELLANADMPLDGLSVKDGELIYNDHHWDGMSSADQMMVATSIVRKLNPKCGFVLLDSLESMDPETLKQFCQWATDQGLQIIATRVSTGDECSIIIEDGQAAGHAKEEVENV